MKASVLLLLLILATAVHAQTRLPDTVFESYEVTMDDLPPVMHADIDPRHMVVSMLFHRATTQAPEQFNPEEYMQWCPDTEKMAEVAISRMKELGLYEHEALCAEYQERQEQCIQKSSRMCDMQAPGQPCPPDKSTFLASCMERNREWESQQTHLTEQNTRMCEEQWRMQQQSCDMAARQPAGYEIEIETPEHCKQSKEEYLAECASRFQQPDFAQMCEQQWVQMESQLVKMCGEMEERRAECREKTQEMCSFASDLVAKCRAITDEEIQDAMHEQAAFICKTAPYRQQQARVFRHIEGAPEPAVVTRLLEAGQHVPEELKPALDEETAEFIEVTESLTALEEKHASRGAGYKFRQFLGLAAEEERQDAAAINNSAARLEETIERLEEIAQQLDNEQAKSAILEQVAHLRERQSTLSELAARKEQKARGILSMFG